MNRLTLLVASTAAAGLALCASTPAGAAARPAGTAETVVSCGNSALQSGLSTRVCAEVTGTTVAFYGRVALAGPPSPGSPAPATRELVTTLSVGVVGGAAPETQVKPVLFTTTTLEVRGPVTTVACGSTVRGTFGVASYPWTARPVAHEVTIPC
ncbi:hypothetical protein [Streptomyces sp. NPDC091268]|uniref:hypothetical protein n=1 Tax=Streptomyces sp. NPDC091268 TaxID=3365979 RepID=UPI0038013FC8